MSPGGPWLVAGGALSLAAAALHIGVIFGGPAWYRFFGAGEAMARAAERGAWQPTLITLGIATVLAIWAAYAFSGAGVIARMPLLRTALVVISAIYLLRGLVLFHAMIFMPAAVTPFLVWSSLIVLVYGLAYGIGTWLAWPALSAEGAL
jgi:hypothetical protein